MQKGEATEEEATITDWISSNLSLSHESLGRRLQVPLQQVVIDIHVEPAPQATESTQSERRSQKFTRGQHIKIAHILSASQLLCAILRPAAKRDGTKRQNQQKLAAGPGDSVPNSSENKGSEPTLPAGRDLAAEEAGSQTASRKIPATRRRAGGERRRGSNARSGVAASAFAASSAAEFGGGWSARARYGGVSSLPPAPLRKKRRGVTTSSRSR